MKQYSVYDYVNKDVPVEDITTPLTVEYTITEGGSHTYTIEETRAIIAHMREHDCSIESAIYELVDESSNELVDMDYPESYGSYSDIYDCQYAGFMAEDEDNE